MMPRAEVRASRRRYSCGAITGTCRVNSSRWIAAQATYCGRRAGQVKKGMNSDYTLGDTERCPESNGGGDT